MRKSRTYILGLGTASLMVLSCGAALADGVVVLSLAGEAYDGPPTFEVRMGDKLIGTGALNAAIDTEKTGRLYSNPRPRAYLQQFSFIVPDSLFSAKADITVALTNDKYKDVKIGRDRNVFVDSITVNGLSMQAADLMLMTGKKQETLDFQAGLLPVYESNSRAVAVAPPEGWPKVTTMTGMLGTAFPNDTDWSSLTQKMPEVSTK